MPDKPVRPYADGVADYALAGWPCILPVPGAAKHPPPVGFTGADGRDTDAQQLVAWAGSHGDSSIAIRMPDGVIGLDVDHYRKGEVDKRGGDSLAEYEQRWGALPPTWRSSARDLPSGIRFYRVPAGRYATKLGESIEIIQRHHRYAVVWPSPHVEVGQPYRWYAPDGSVSATVPKPNELPELPEAWVAGLREGATEAGPAAAEVGRGQALLAVVMADQREPCGALAKHVEQGRAALSAAESGSRHDTMTAQVHAVVLHGARGHPGAGGVLAALRETWDSLTVGEDRSGEFERMLLTSARKAVTAIGGTVPQQHQCSLPPPNPAQPEAYPASAPSEPGGPLVYEAARFTQAHLAEEFARAVLVGRFRWARGLRWLAWDGRRWAITPEEAVIEQSRLWAKHMLSEAARALQEGRCDIKYVSAWHSVAKTAASLRAIVSLARGIAGVITEASEFDAHADLLNVGNGVVDLRTGQLRAHDPDLLMTKLAPASYRAGADHRDWRTALGALPDDVLDWYQVRLGQSITGHMTPDDVMVIQQGGGENGKTTVLGAVEKVLGDYAVLVSDKVILADPRAHTTERMELRGARFALIEETPEARRLSVSLLKKVLGTPTMTARHIAQDEVRWEATHSLWLSTNYLPLVEEVDHGTWRRLLTLKFPYTYVKPPTAVSHALERRADPTLRDRMRSSPSGQHEAVLAWLVRGAIAWYAADKVLPPPPERVANDTREWRKDSDLVLGYLDARLAFDPARHVMSTDLLSDLNGWLAQHGHRPWSDKVFASRFGGHSEVARHHVERRKQRRNGHLSRPSSTGAPMPLGPVPGTYSAWVGLRFAEGENPPPTSPNEDHVPPVPGPVGGSQEKPPRGNPRPNPEQPEQDQKPSEADESKGIGTGTSAKITKAAQKAAERDQARRDAAGESYPLPAAVDRAGVITALTVADAGRLLAEVVVRSGVLTVDVEHTGYPVGHPDYALRTVQLGDKLAAVDLDPADPAQAEVIRTALAAAPRLQAHSASADLVPLVEAGLTDESAWERMYDTVIPAKLADPASTGSDPGLKELATAVLGEQATAPSADQARAQLFKLNGWLTDTKATTLVARSGWAQVDPTCSTMIRYAASDVLDAAAVAERLPQLPAEVVERERAVQRITARVAHRGLRIDRDQVARLEAEHRPAEAAAAARIREYGVENPGSDRQLADKLTELDVRLPRTKPSVKHPDGQPSVAAGVLEALKGDAGPAGELISAVLDYRHHETVLTTFLEPYRVLCERGDGRARPTVYTLGTDTGRMSCVRPNLQQLPRQGGVRACITADPGYVLISADFEGVEIRGMAALSQDPALVQMLAEGAEAKALVDAGQMSKREWQSLYDLHARVAAQAFGPDWTKADRYMAKRGVFGWAYGGGVPTLARQVGAPEHVMAAIVDSLQLVAPGYVAWADELKRRVRHGYTAMPTYAGRIIHLPGEYPHKAPNYAIQGTARELLVDALLAWDQTRWAGGVVLPVHDEIVAVVPEADAEAATEELVRCMTRELYGVQIAAEASKPSFAWQDSA